LQSRRNRIWPFGCAFRDVEISDSEIEQTSGSPFAAWHAEARGRVFFMSSLDQETGDGDA
jgi:hypothetical protein